MASPQAFHYRIYDRFGENGKDAVRKIIEAATGNKIDPKIMNAWPSHTRGGVFPPRYAIHVERAARKKGIECKPSDFELKRKFRHRIRRPAK